MTITDKVLERVKDWLAPGGRFYLVAVAQNRPSDIVARLKEDGLDSEVSCKQSS
jgi:release factor glutamine methyltransferase